MIQIRKAQERGHFNFGWLDTYHSFSFGEYYDPERMGFRSLRVINEDRVAPAEGFDTHPHRDMEIITYILEGSLAHKDSLGTGSVIRPGDSQRMSAGTGIEHSEFNASKDEPVHLLQIWILPEKKGIKPGYEQKHFPQSERLNQLRLLASRDGRQGSVTIHQDVSLYATILEKDKKLTFEVPQGRHVWVQLAKGGLSINDVVLAPGDGAAISQEKALTLQATSAAEFLLFDLS